MSISNTREKTEFLGHPFGLVILFFTEMWERFSYYGMRALLVLYMTQHLLTSIDHGQPVIGATFLASVIASIFGPLSHQALASQIYGLYTGFVYFTPFFGGLIADRYLGQRRSIYIGGFLMAIGHFLMAFENLFYIALLFLIVGNGFFKPNVSSQIGSLYERGDKRVDRAFTLFYMGINLGAFLSPLVCGTLGQRYGWHYGFTAAGFGMLLGIVIYHFGRHHLPVEAPIVRRDSASISPPAKLSSDDYKRIAALFFLCVVNILFWGVYEQQGNALQIWADKNTDWNFLGFMIPSTWFQSFNPLFIIVFAPLIDLLWAWQSRKKSEPSTVSKMAIGCFLCCSAYVFLLLLLSALGVENKVYFMWIAVAVLMFTLGELYISPVGLSLVVKLAPARMVSMLMGLWFLSIFCGNYLAGYIGSFYEALGQTHFFMLLTVMSGFAGLIFLIFNRPLRAVIKD